MSTMNLDPKDAMKKFLNTLWFELTLRSGSIGGKEAEEKQFSPEMKQSQITVSVIKRIRKAGVIITVLN